MWRAHYRSNWSFSSATGVVGLTVFQEKNEKNNSRHIRPFEQGVPEMACSKGLTLLILTVVFYHLGNKLPNNYLNLKS
jgi:hypothetical protein